MNHEQQQIALESQLEDQRSYWLNKSKKNKALETLDYGGNDQVAIFV